MMTTSLTSAIAASSTRCFCSRRSAAPRPAGLTRAVSAVSTEPEQKQAVSNRREAVGFLSGVAALLVAAPAFAFLGIGEGSDNDTYTDDTKAILGKVEQFLALDKNDPNRDEFVSGFRNDINSWVAKYRRRDSVSGRPSFGLSYTILNALAGSFNSFGNNAPLPKKRLERINKELADANRQLARGR